MPDSIVKETLREIEPLDADELIGPAARRVIDAGLPALPAVERDGRFAGIFGEREFMAALFPGYVGELASAAMVSRSVDETIERRSQCAEEPIRDYLTTDHVWSRTTTPTPNWPSSSSTTGPDRPDRDPRPGHRPTQGSAPPVIRTARREGRLRVAIARGCAGATAPAEGLDVEGSRSRTSGAI